MFARASSVLGSRARGYASTLAVFVLVGCAETEPHEVLLAQEPIIGGQLAIGIDEVVMISGPQKTAGCSGTVVAERAVITAKHCVQLPDSLEPEEPSQLRVGVGRTLHSGAGLAWLSVASVHALPGVYTATESETLFGSDLAILILSEPTPLPPRRVRFSSVDELMGATVQAVGYGLTLEGETGTRYQVSTTITGVTQYSLVVDGTVCQGDSGGPLFDSEGSLLGIVSLGQGPGCPGGPSFFERLDTHRDFILSTIAAAGDCVVEARPGAREQGVEGREPCDGYDNDCDGEVDRACAQLGQACTEDRECQAMQGCVEQLCIELSVSDGGVPSDAGELADAGSHAAVANDFGAGDCTIGVTSRREDSSPARNLLGATLVSAWWLARRRKRRRTPRKPC